MDIWAYVIPGCQDLLVDVTARSEMAKSHGTPAAPRTHEQWHRSVETQERHKLAEYPRQEGGTAPPA